MPSVLVEKVTKNYRDVRALNEVSLNLQEPGCIGILGPNGAGKTTLLKILTNIVKPTEGVALLNGINVSDEPEKAADEERESGNGKYKYEKKPLSYLTGRR